MWNTFTAESKTHTEQSSHYHSYCLCLLVKPTQSPKHTHTLGYHTCLETSDKWVKNWSLVLLRFTQTACPSMSSNSGGNQSNKQTVFNVAGKPAGCAHVSSDEPTRPRSLPPTEDSPPPPETWWRITASLVCNEQRQTLLCRTFMKCEACVHR